MELTVELETALWQIANLALDCHDDKLTGAEYVEKAFDALKQVKNINYDAVLPTAICCSANCDKPVHKEGSVYCKFHASL